jgi:hypothetical protein
MCFAIDNPLAILLDLMCFYTAVIMNVFLEFRISGFYHFYLFQINAQFVISVSWNAFVYNIGLLIVILV